MIFNTILILLTINCNVVFGRIVGKFHSEHMGIVKEAKRMYPCDVPASVAPPTTVKVV